MSDINNNGRVPIKIVELLMENLEMSLKNSQEKINDDTTELRRALVTIITKLGSMSVKIDKMILVVRVVFAILAAAVLLAGFGSHILYKKNSETLTKEIIKRIEIERKIDRKNIESIIEDYVDKLKEEHDDEASN